MPSEIENARMTSARFYRVDLHVHSPLSHDWNNDAKEGYTPNPALNRITEVKDITEEVLAAYYSALKDSGLHVVAITDHMKWSFGVAIAEYAQTQPGSLLVLPGIEINVRFDVPVLRDYRIHVLAVFPPNIGKTKIDKIFPEPFPDEYERNGKTAEVEYKHIDHLLEKVHDLNGRLIAAHIYCNNGLRLAYTNEADLMLKSIEAVNKTERDTMYRKVGDHLKDDLFRFDCLQVTQTTEPIHFKNAQGDLAVSLLCGSDAHHVTSLGNPDKITYIKMGKLDYASLCEAFKYPDTRIRFRGNLPEIKPPRVRGVRIVGSKFDEKSFFNNIVLGFSDNLTCIVGPRGSGKSAIIDGIRYAMGYNRTLGEIERVKEQVLERQKNTLHASRIEILYEKADSQTHKLVATYDQSEEYSTQVMDLERNILNIADVESCGEYPLNLYGWNEIELLGENPKTQRDSLDRFILELSALKTERNEAYADLNKNNQKCDEQLAVLDIFFKPGQNRVSFLRLKEYETEFNKLNSPEMEATFTHLDSINHKLKFLGKLKVELQGAIEKLGQLSPIDFDILLKNQNEEKDWCKDLIEERLVLKKYNDIAATHKAELLGKLGGYLEIISQEETTLTSEKNTASKKIKDAIGDEQSITADLRNNAKKRLDTAREEFEKYKKELSSFQGLLKVRTNIVKRIKDINGQIFATRNRELSEITAKIQIVEDESFRVALRLEQEKDRAEFLEGLMSNLMKLNYVGQWKRKKIPELIADKLTPFDFADALLSGNSKALIHKKELHDGEVTQSYEIDSAYAEQLCTANNPIEQLDSLKTFRYSREKMNVLFQIEQIPFDDSFYIVLNDRPIQKCSPGQRCSAMLPIVTLTSDAPIIIDQPEDNLDNRLVSRAVFKILAKLKETRQIILATHNPNILVSGDAEQVVVLNSEGAIDEYGSIDEPKIVSNVIELMEGGKEAFERRQAKYGIKSRRGT